MPSVFHHQTDVSLSSKVDSSLDMANVGHIHDIDGISSLFELSELRLHTIGGFT